MATASDERVIVYVYEKGTFDRITESQPQKETGLRFQNAFLSTMADKVGNDLYYIFYPIPAGEYEICAVKYRYCSENDSYHYLGFLRAATDFDGKVSHEVIVQEDSKSDLNLVVLSMIK